MDPYVVIGDTSTYGSVSVDRQRYFSDGTAMMSSANVPYVNTTKLGLYYYQVNVRNLNFGENLYLDKTFHVYSDRLYQQYRLINSGSVAKTVNDFGFEIKLNKASVAKFEIFDGTNKTVSMNTSASGNGIAFDSFRYAAFDISGVGVVAIINATDSARLTINYVNDGTNEYYVVRQIVSAGGTVAAGGIVELGSRLYTDSSHTFDGVAEANRQEENPFTAREITVSGDGASFVGYNKVTGYYEFTIEGTDFITAYNNPDKKYIEKITLNVSEDRDVYFYIHSQNLLEGAALVDDNDLLLPIGVQVSKNFGHEKEEPVYDPTDSVYGDTIFPVSATKGKAISFSVINVYQNWGKYPLKQLSSVSYYVSYYHLSTGVRETNCIAPYFGTSVNKEEKGSWILPDFRGASGDKQSYVGSSGNVETDLIQTNSVGTLYGVSNGKDLSASNADLGIYQSSDIKSAGLTHVDLVYSYISKDGKYRYTYRHVEMPQEDESRTYYTVEIEFIDAITLKYNEFSIFSFDGRSTTTYANAAYLDENGVHKEVNAYIKNLITSSGKKYSLHKGGSYFTYYNCTATDESEERGNFGLIVKNYAITQNGKSSSLGLAFYDSVIKKGSITLNRGSLTLDGSLSGEKFYAGDKITVSAILLPYGTQNNCDNVKKVYEDSVTNAIKLTASVGTTVNDEFIPTVTANNNMAIFAVSGGVASSSQQNVYYTIKVKGISSLGVLKVEKRNAAGEWQTVELSSADGFDGYDVNYENGKFDYSFVIEKTTADTEYRVSVTAKKQ